MVGVGWGRERDGDTEQNKPTRPTKRKMKSSAFAHSTMRPWPGAERFPGTKGRREAPNRVRPGTRGRLERDGPDPRTWERAGEDGWEEAESRGWWEPGAREGQREARGSGHRRARPSPGMPFASPPGHPLRSCTSFVRAPLRSLRLVPLASPGVILECLVNTSSPEQHSALRTPHPCAGNCFRALTNSQSSTSSPKSTLKRGPSKPCSSQLPTHFRSAVCLRPNGLRAWGLCQ